MLDRATTDLLSRGRVDLVRLRELFERGFTDADLGRAFNVTVSTVVRHRREQKLLRRKDREIHSRHAPKTVLDRCSKMPPVNHPALHGARTIYPSTVVGVCDLPNILVSGDNSRKIGSRIFKGWWKGFPVFTLTLEERATCPTSCAMWRSCYGNNMHFARRVRHGAAFEARLAEDVARLASLFPSGFAIRLHVLGDFYSVAYVDLWRALIEKFPNLHVFGFTARCDRGDAITRALVRLVVDYWPRAALRFSNAPTLVASTVTIEHPFQTPPDAILCPAQVGRTKNCGTCALCWSTERRIAFLRH